MSEHDQRDKPASTGEDAPSSGSFTDPQTHRQGTAAGNPLAGTDEPQDEPVYPEGSDDA
jgi:hypothetical protein